MTEKIGVAKEEAGQRLDKFLVFKFPGQARACFQKMIKNGLVTVNGRQAKVHHFLKEGEEVAVRDDEVEVIEEKKFEIPIIWESKDFLVINKPSGLIVHGGVGIKEKTLVDWLLKHYPEIVKVGEDLSRPGIVHRLDKEVSGLMVIAKTQDAFDCLKKQFKGHKIKKEYLALVYGKVTKETEEIKFYLERSRRKGKIVARPDEIGRPATTQFEVVRYLKEYSLLKVRPLTGRTHQIRVHLKAYGYPVVGDKIYRPKGIKKRAELERIFLHAAFLGFFNLEEKWLTFNSSLPVELDDFLKKLVAE